MDTDHTTRQLPASVLHRFPGQPRHRRDVDVYMKDGVPWVRAALRGVSFLQLDSMAEHYHGRFRGPCSLTVPRAELSAGFVLPTVPSGVGRHERKGRGSAYAPSPVWFGPETSPQSYGTFEGRQSRSTLAKCGSRRENQPTTT
eukprot:364273-Chlamydomonas_euryale.AAC.5